MKKTSIGEQKQWNIRNLKDKYSKFTSDLESCFIFPAQAQRLGNRSEDLHTAHSTFPKNSRKMLETLVKMNQNKIRGSL